MLHLFLVLLILVACVGICRIVAIVRSDARRARPAPKLEMQPSSLAVFLGSGGHTHESLALLASLPSERYSPRLYIYSYGDAMSLKKAVELEKRLDPAASTATRVLSLPRARKVGQRLSTSVFTTAYTLLHTLYHFTLQPALAHPAKPFADVLILNGPGTAVPLVMAVYLSRFFGLPSPKIIYLESFARTSTLSATGRLLRPLADRFLVQWPGALGTGRGECVGRVV